MNNNNEKSYRSMHEKEKFIHTSADFINALRLSMMGLTINEEQYRTFETVAVELMTDILRVYEKIMNEQTDAKSARTKAMMLAKDTVQDGLADLVADANDGMSYEQFCTQLEEWKGRWFDQLRVK